MKSLVGNVGIGHVEILLQNLGNIGAAHVDAVRVFYGPSNLLSSPDSSAFYVANHFDCELKLAVFRALLLP